MVEPSDAPSPRLLVESLSTLRRSDAGLWLVSWRIQNREDSAVDVLSTWLPHDHFWSERRDFVTSLRLAPEGAVDLQVAVSCNDKPGTVVENAFLVLRLTHKEQMWRAFVRLRIAVDAAGVPQHTCEAVTVHEVGFSS